ncbi:MAG: OmpL47-type beta-barrel domain-containing protein [Cytophagales bacterium]
MRKPYRKLFLAIFLSIQLVEVTTCYAQEQLTHEPRFYTDSKGIYVNANLEYFLTIQDAKGNTIKLSRTASNSSSLKFDGSGKHFLVHKDLIENKDVLFEVMADGVAPKVKAIIMKSRSEDETNFYNIAQRPDTIRLEAKDDLSGVLAIYYSVDKAAYIEYSKPLILPKGLHQLLYYAVDNVGNVSAKKTLVVDLREPISELNLLDSSKNVITLTKVLSKHHSFKLDFQKNDMTDLVGYKGKLLYSFDGKEERVYSGPIPITGLANGEHVLNYSAADQYGNREKLNSFNFYLDKKEPSVQLEFMNNKFYSSASKKNYISPRTKVRLMAFDDKSGVKSIYYKTAKDSYYTKYVEPFSVEPTGIQTIKYYGVDSLNNSGKDLAGGAGKGTFDFYVDVTGPSVSYRFGSPTYLAKDSMYLGAKSEVIISATDSESGLENISYQIDKGNLIDYSAPFTVGEKGLHTVTIQATDKVGNTTEKVIKFIVDNTAPNLAYSFDLPRITSTNEGISVYPSRSTLFLSAEDQLVGYQSIYYQINGGNPIPYNQPIKNFQKNTEYRISVRLVDKLGNEKKEEIKFRTSE